MPKESGFSKAFAGAFVFLTVSVVVGIVTMVIFYKTQIGPLHPTARPTPPSVTTGAPPVTRLPEHLLPRRYRVVLQPHLYTRIVEVVNVTSPNQTMLFTGNSSVSFLCVRSTAVVYLHSEGLELSGAAVTDLDSGERVGVSWMKQREDKGRFLEVQLGAPLAAGGNYSLFLAFRGTMTENLYGLFVSRYSEGTPAYDGDTDTERFLAATLLEPTDARRVFPCFDEPALKAVFDVTIVHRKETFALGNAASKDTFNLDDEWKVTRFHPTPKMSTYLFAFTVSEFEKSVSSPPGRVEIKTYGRPDAIAAGHADYAAVVTGKILKFYEDHFQIGYRQKTLDQVALPDLGLAAMENWGLVTYQEGGLLYEEGVSSLLHKDNIAFLVAHELAHQWFGNLVTMKWWNDIWLNEGFATYLSVVAVDHVEPHSNMKDAQFMTLLHAAFEQDALASSHPLSPPEEDVQMTYEIEDMFDSITYCKGAAVLRMLSFIVTERVFTKGIRMYLSDFSFKNTDQNDLWKYIQKAEDEGGFTNVAKVMNTWTKQIGFPVITINTTSGEIYQKHFLFNDSSESNLWWSVPISFMSNTKDSSYFLLETSDTMTKDEFISKSGEWILANINCTGYYRVNYNPENWERLLTQLETNPQRIPLMNRGQLVDDAFNLARAKLIEVTLALNSTRFLHDERGYIPWKSTVKNLEYFVLMFDRSEVYGPMQAYLREQVSGLYDFFRNDTDHSQVPKDHSAQHNQIIAIDVACSNALPECVEMATKMFADWMSSNDTNSIHPNLRSVVYCQAVAAGGREEWEFAWDRYQSSVDTSEKEQLREALSCTKHIWLLNRYLEYTLNPEKIRLMDVGSTILSVADNVAGQALAWNFVRANWDYVYRTGPARLIEGVTRRFSTKFELEELERFAADYYLTPTNFVQQAMEQTRVNIQWVGENADAVLEWFENEVGW